MTVFNKVRLGTPLLNLKQHRSNIQSGKSCRDGLFLRFECQFLGVEKCTVNYRVQGATELHV